jgi:hypothetical protein
MKRLKMSALQSEIVAVRQLLEEGQGLDPLGDLSLRNRLEGLQRELEELQGQDQKHASVALMFYGEPVQGSRGIDAEFAGKAIQNYQLALSKHMVSLAGGNLGARGPIPERKLSRLNVTDVVHGSFGFFLEEDSEDTGEMFETALHNSVKEISKIMDGIAGVSDQDFEAAIDQVDSRTFASIKALFELMHREGAAFKIVDDEEERAFDAARIERAYERVEQVDLSEDQIELGGILIGVIPIGRRFEFREIDTDVVLKGVVSPKLSADFLERIQHDEQVIGKRWSASFLRRRVVRPDGRERTEFTLLELNQRLD